MKYVLKNPYIDAIRFDGDNIEEIKQFLSDIDKCSICDIRDSTLCQYGLCISCMGMVISIQPLYNGCYVIKKGKEAYVREESAFINDYKLDD